MTGLSSKPLLRGQIHQEAFFVALGACALLIANSSNQKSLIASVVYSLSLLLLFGSSAIYHRIQWEPKARVLLKRIDHSAIFVLIAGTTTPFAVLALPDVEGSRLLWVIWTAAIGGVAQSIFWVSSPKWVTTLLCIIVGWMSLPYLGFFKLSLTQAHLVLVVVGGALYSIGAIVYALKKPNFFPGIFGYHELFHLFTVIAAASHFIPIYSLVSRP